MNKVFIDYDGTTYQLPVPPSEISNIIVGTNETHTVVGIGEVCTLGGRELRRFEFESFFPKENSYSFIATSNQFSPPEVYIKLFETLINERKACRFVITGTTINYKVAVEEFEEIYQYGTNDVHYRIALIEYRDISIKTLSPVQEFNKETGEITENKNEAIETPKERPKEGLAINDVITASGKYFYDSFGKSPFGTFPVNFKGKITLVELKNPFPYHISTESNSPLGWVKKEQISHA